ncbi:MAG TPA: signal peptidase I [Jatrophihabitans sp.]|jgi:signal peptidase I
MTEGPGEESVLPESSETAESSENRELSETPEPSTRPEPGPDPTADEEDSPAVGGQQESVAGHEDVPVEDGKKSGKHGKKPKRKAPWWELPALVVGAIVLAILVKSFVLQPFFIPSESMEKTLHGCPTCSGDRILVNKVIYDFRDPHPGDIVVFHAPPGWDNEVAPTPPSNPVLRVVRGFGQLVGFVPPDGEVLVKRVIATGGQTVRGMVTDGKDVVQVSDHGTSGPWKTLNEPFVYLDSSDGRGTFGPITVPKGRLWVMGDHRNDSADSRFHCNPDQSSCGADGDPVTSTVPVTDVIGKAFVIAWPPSRWRTLGTPSTFTQ